MEEQNEKRKKPPIIVWTVPEGLPISEHKKVKLRHYKNCIEVQLKNRRIKIFEENTGLGGKGRVIEFIKYDTESKGMGDNKHAQSKELRPGLFVSGLAISEEMLDIIGLFWAEERGLKILRPQK